MSGTGGKPSSRFDVMGHLAVMRRYARSLTRDDAEAEDLVHDALVRAYERRAGYSPERGAASGDGSRRDKEGRNGLRGWLLSILHNAFVDGRRTRTARERREGETLALADIAQPPAQEHRVRLSQVRDAFMELPEEQRAALHLVAIEGLGYVEAAATLGIAQGTLMSRLARARAALRAIEEGAGVSNPARLRIVGGADDPSR